MWLKYILFLKILTAVHQKGVIPENICIPSLISKSRLNVLSKFNFDNIKFQFTQIYVCKNSFKGHRCPYSHIDALFMPFLIIDDKRHRYRCQATIVDAQWHLCMCGINWRHNGLHQAPGLFGRHWVPTPGVWNKLSIDVCDMPFFQSLAPPSSPQLTDQFNLAMKPVAYSETSTRSKSKIICF